MSDKEITSFIPNSKVKMELINILISNIKIWCETSQGIRPKNWIQSIFHSIHDLSHPGIRSTKKKISHSIFGPL